MVLMIVVCLLVHAHADNRNHPPALPKRARIVSLLQGPVIEDDRLDEIAMLVFGHSVSMIQYLYSVTGTEQSYRGKPALQIFNRKYPSSRYRPSEYAFFNRVPKVYDNLAKSVWTRSQARKSLIKEWLKLNEGQRNSLKGNHPAFVVIDDMTRAYILNRDTTTPAAPGTGKTTFTQAEGPVGGYDRLDEIAMLVFGHSVSMLQYLYSVTHTEQSYRGKPALQIFNRKYPSSRYRSSEYAFFNRIPKVYDNLAKSVWTRSQARESLIKEWLKLNEGQRNSLKGNHPAFVVIDDMARAQARYII